MSTPLASHGRGGAGNISKDKVPTGATEGLVTPTIKSDKYTTGRGGTGNMAKNDPARPEVARESQDVKAPPIREHEGPVHVGRGGAANYAKGSEQVKTTKDENGLGDRLAAEKDKLKAKEKGLLEKIGLKK